MIIEIDIYHIPTGKWVLKGVQNVSEIAEYEALKDLMIEAVTGKLSFLKLRDEDGVDGLVGSSVLIDCKIIIKPKNENN